MNDLSAMVIALLVAVLLVGGALFCLLAGIGLLRFPDLYTRMHAASKAGTVGSCLLLLAAGLHALEATVIAKALAGCLFFLLTAPVSAHLLARAAHRAGVKPSTLTVVDQMPRDKPVRSPSQD